jgi:hypothetical protein
LLRIGQEKECRQNTISSTQFVVRLPSEEFKCETFSLDAKLRQAAVAFRQRSDAQPSEKFKYEFCSKDRFEYVSIYLSRYRKVIVVRLQSGGRPIKLQNVILPNPICGFSAYDRGRTSRS